ncbi:MAG TPA: acyl carrier protein [Ktedonobacteraceae bacterium]|nr:acyl carrier protein [Ktedonobacteraceae bacterium]
MTQHLPQSDITTRVEKIVQEHVGNEHVLSPDTHLQNELDIDSLERVEIGVKLEKAFNILLTNSMLQSAVTLGDFFQLVTDAKQATVTTRASFKNLSIHQA